MMAALMNLIHAPVAYLNGSKLFAGIVMIMLNVGSRFVTLRLSRSSEEYVKMAVTKQVLVFSMAWMGTRDIYHALALTAIFVVLSDHVFNEESPYCAVPEKYRVLRTLVDADGDGAVSEDELKRAVAVLERDRRSRTRMAQRRQFVRYGHYEAAGPAKSSVLSGSPAVPGVGPGRGAPGSGG